MRFEIPLGLSPPDFSAMKINKERDENAENLEKQMHSL
jgi:hypothetical protein